MQVLTLGLGLVMPLESAADKNKESAPGQTLYADFKFAVYFLIGGCLKSDYDENSTFKRTTRRLELFRIQHYNHPGLQDILLYQCKEVSSLLSSAELL